MSIVSAINDITEAQGGTPDTSGSIIGAIDALNDTLAGSSQDPGHTIEDAIKLLGENIGGSSKYQIQLQAPEGITLDVREYYIDTGDVGDPITEASGGTILEAHASSDTLANPPVSIEINNGQAENFQLASDNEYCDFAMPNMDIIVVTSF